MGFILGPEGLFILAIRSVHLAIIVGYLLSSDPTFAQEVSEQKDAPAKGELAAESKESGWQIKPRWRLQYDVADIDGPEGLVGQGSFSAIRRARLGVDIEMPAGFSARIDAELQDEPIQLLDAYVMWKRNEYLVIAGQQKAINPLDLHSSNLYTTFMERPAFYGAFNYGRGTGILAGYERDDFGVYGGVFTDNLALLNDVKNNSLFADFRSYWSPQFGDVRFHVAGSYHIRDLKDFSKAPSRYRQRPFVRLTDERYVGTTGLLVEKETRYGFEAAATWKRLHAAGELHWLEADRVDVADPRFFGAYAEVGFFLTNDARPLKTGAFGTIKPAKPLGSGGIGAVQVNVRYDHLNLNSAGVTGGTQDGYLASLIWTPVDFLRLMVNYARLDYRSAAIAVAGNRNYTVDVIAARFQLSY